MKVGPLISCVLLSIFDHNLCFKLQGNIKAPIHGEHKLKNPIFQRELLKQTLKSEDGLNILKFRHTYHDLSTRTLNDLTPSLKNLKDKVEKAAQYFENDQKQFLKDTHSEAVQSVAYLKKKVWIYPNLSSKSVSKFPNSILDKKKQPIEIIVRSRVNLSDSLDIDKDNITEYVEVHTNNITGKITTVYKNLTKTLVSIKDNDDGVYNIIKDNSKGTIETILNDGMETLTGVVEILNGSVNFIPKEIAGTLGSAFSGSGLFKATKEVSTVVESVLGIKKKSPPPRKGKRHTSYLGKVILFQFIRI